VPQNIILTGGFLKATPNGKNFLCKAQNGYSEWQSLTPTTKGGEISTLSKHHLDGTGTSILQTHRLLCSSGKLICCLDICGGVSDWSGPGCLFISMSHLMML